MRPIDKGDAPQTYTNYRDAFPDLVDRLGTYCSYCERRIETNLAVEHVQPKSLNPTLKLEWSNFLLACVNCNSAKGNQEVTLTRYLWPDHDNTFLSFSYHQGGFVKLKENLTESQQTKAQALLDLVNLHHHPASGYPNTTKADQRWKSREEAYQSAELARTNYEQLQSESAKELVLEVAKWSGFFSVWMTVFVDYPEVRKGLIEIFLGTATTCFDENGNPIPRPAGTI